MHEPEPPANPELSPVEKARQKLLDRSNHGRKWRAAALRDYEAAIRAEVHAEYHKETPDEGPELESTRRRLEAEIGGGDFRNYHGLLPKDHFIIDEFEAACRLDALRCAFPLTASEAEKLRMAIGLQHTIQRSIDAVDTQFKAFPEDYRKIALKKIITALNEELAKL